ncbi:MAG: tRNA (adenosine(37)-N6)-threonylcarbamoyltransferase complex ATPase subunit type 1 TsaE [Oscillospiraceae bacterium]
MKRTIVTNSAAETEEIGARLARTLTNGDIVALTGGLGAGKTALVRGALRALGCEGPYTSPTFAIVREYDGKTPCAHFDMYRISGERELESTGFYDYLDGKRILFIEWSENVPFIFDGSEITVGISGFGDGAREIEIEGADLL